MTPSQLTLRIGALIASVLMSAHASPVRPAAVLPTTQPQALYVLPLYAILQASDAEVAAQVQQLRARLGPEGPHARLGFTTYVSIDMDWSIDPANAAAVRQALAPTVQNIDTILARAVANDIPVCLSFLTAVRAAYDAAQLASEVEDRRVSQWHADNSLAAGWWTYSRYARKQLALRQAYLQELGRVVANRMAIYPAHFVAATGDGEIELSSDGNGQLADYSPFAVAEFRDWLRGAGLYAPGQPYEGQAYSLAARYNGDISPAFDSSGDGHSLNGDFGTSFTTWDLEHFDWKLDDPLTPDPRAIPISVYSAGGFNPLPNEIPSGFDPPRAENAGAPWWETWALFRQTMVWHYNQDFAKWMTTTRDGATGATIPSDRWYSDQIPADLIQRPNGVPQDPNLRLLTSASPWWTSDVSPYGSIGVTSFNVVLSESVIATSLDSIAPVVSQRNVPWMLTEWHPGLKVPGAPDAPIERFRADMDLVKQYRPRIVVPFFWGSATFPIQDTPFETTLRELVAAVKTGQPADTRMAIEAPAPGSTVQQPFTLSGWAVDLGTIRGPGWGAGVDRIHVDAYRNPGPNVEPPIDLGAVPYGIARSDVAATFGDAQFTSSGFSLSVTRLPVGTYDLVVSARSAVTGTFNASQTIRVTIVAPPGIPPQPFGIVDTPFDNAIAAGEVAVTGWALDDHGVSAIEVFRSAIPGEPSVNGMVFVGNAVRVAGARGDIAAAYPALPENDRAGWGLMVLSNMFPNQGNGLFTLSVFVKDLDGFSTLIGTPRVDIRNGSSKAPFGTIDTPAQGATVSGVTVNFGWVLTPNPNVVPFDGSTIEVFVDGVLQGHPEYNFFRPDIATLFPGYANSNGAIGFFLLDTTLLANGVHTIFWIARDNQGNAAGLGSRYFSVFNP